MVLQYAHSEALEKIILAGLQKKSSQTPAPHPFSFTGAL